MNYYILSDQGRPEEPGECRMEHAQPYRLTSVARSCPTCGEPLEPARWDAPHRAEISGSHCGDLIPGAGFEMIVSRTAWVHLEACGITGWELSGVLEARLDREYVVVRPHVSVTRLDETRSRLVWVRPPSCETCRLGVRERVGPVIFDPATLDGTDIFVPSGAYGLKVVTEKFKRCIERNGLERFRLIAADSYREDGS